MRGWGIIHKEGKVSSHDQYLHDREKDKLRPDYSRISGEEI